VGADVGPEVGEKVGLDVGPEVGTIPAQSQSKRKKYS
jgi:hypothetical protein